MKLTHVLAMIGLALCTTLLMSGCVRNGWDQYGFHPDNPGWHGHDAGGDHGSSRPDDHGGWNTDNHGHGGHDDHGNGKPDDHGNGNADNHDNGGHDDHAAGNAGHHDGGTTTHHDFGRDDNGQRAILSTVAAQGLPVRVTGIAPLPDAAPTLARYQVHVVTTDKAAQPLVGTVDYNRTTGAVMVEK